MKLYISLNSLGGGGGGGGYIININYINMMVNINYNDSFVSAMRGVWNCWLNGFDSNTWLSDSAADGSDNNEDCTDSNTWLSDSADDGSDNNEDCTDSNTWLSDSADDGGDNNEDWTVLIVILDWFSWWWWW